MGAVLDEGLEHGHVLEVDVADPIDDVRLRLPPVEVGEELGVDGEEVEHVPEDLGDEVFPSRLGDDVGRAQALDPGLR